ncbi:MAG: type II toxin-antitoxin system HicB family antitoxin [Acidaminococcaceae bacterium]
MKKRIYPAIFHPETVSGYSVSFPDLIGCNTEGDTLQEALAMSEDALGIYLYSLQQDNEIAPEATSPEKLKLEAGEFISLVVWDELAYLERTDNKAVNKTVTMPSWMNKKAEALKINFSQTLQEALLQKLNIEK